MLFLQAAMFVVIGPINLFAMYAPALVYAGLY